MFAKQEHDGVRAERGGDDGRREVNERPVRVARGFGFVRAAVSAGGRSVVATHSTGCMATPANALGFFEAWWSE